MTDPILETIRRTAVLARLALTEEEAASLAPQFARILEAFRQLERFEAPDGTGLEGTRAESPRLRSDEPHPFVRPDQLTENAPRPVDGFYAVPKTVGGDA